MGASQPISRNHLQFFFSIHALWNALPSSDMEVWRNFVMACSCLCSTVLTETKALLAHSYLLKFCQGFEQLYGKHRVTPNIHLHTHLVECVLDYGPVYSFWLFSFERSNGILGEYGTNQRAVEIQLMRKFLSSQFMKDLPLPVEFQDIIKPLLNRLYFSAIMEFFASTEPINVLLRYS